MIEEMLLEELVVEDSLDLFNDSDLFNEMETQYHLEENFYQELSSLNYNELELSEELWNEVLPEAESAMPFIPEPEIVHLEAIRFDLTNNTLENYELSEWEVYGDPIEEVNFWSEQTHSDSCAIAAQKAVIESVTGVSIPEEQLIEIATEEGFFAPTSENAGTYAEDMARFLDFYNIPNELGHHNTLGDILDALNNNERVIVGLNSAEIYHPTYDFEGNLIDQSLYNINHPHAVNVIGAKFNPLTGDFNIIINDPGIGSGAGLVVDVNDFMNAWNDHNNFAVITRTGGIV